jgi:putative membrane protein
LEDGSGQLADGLGSANDGGVQLADGALAAQAGAKKAAKGAEDIEDGMRQLEAGLLALADDPSKLPALIDGINQFRAQALGGIAAAIGTTGSTFPGGPGGAIIPSARNIGAQVNAGLDAGSADLLAAADEARTSGGQLEALADGQILTVNGVKAGLGCPAGAPPLCAALDTLTEPAGSNLVTLNNTKAAGQTLAGAKADELEAGGNSLAAASDAMDGQEQILSGVYGSVIPGGSADQGLDALIDGVNEVRDGVRTDGAGGADTLADFQGDLADGLDELAGKDGLGKLARGAETLAEGLNTLSAGGEALADGAGEAAAGSDELVDGLGRLESGGGALADGAETAVDGAGELSSGLGQLEDGSQQLASGNSEAAAGGAELSDGVGQLRDGGSQLADGLVTAEDGSGQLADGLGLAKVGGGQVADGAKQLNEQGTSKLASSVNDANIEQNRNVALVRAMDERSREEGMPVGAPEGATSSAVYSFELAGADGAGRQNTMRLALTGVALAVMAGLGLARRRLLGV